MKNKAPLSGKTKKKAVIIISMAVVAVALGAVIVMRGNRTETHPAQSQTATRRADAEPPPASHTSHSQTPQAERVPAHFETAPARESLPTTLAPEQFTGPTREAYKAAQEIPQTIAQLPCYCHCDIGFGHKSLHSCFEDDHGAHCAVCVNEALLAYRMEKQMGLTPAQIRERIVAQYAARQ
jgi:hypothetical protein